MPRIIPRLIVNVFLSAMLIEQYKSDGSFVERDRTRCSDSKFITFWKYDSMSLEQRFSSADEFLKEQPFSCITASKQQLFRARRARAKP